MGAERHPQPQPTPWAPGPPGRRTRPALNERYKMEKDYDLKVNLFKPPSLMYITTLIPDSLLKELIRDSEKLEADSKKKGYDSQLVGNFESGEQLAVKPGWGEMIEGYPSFVELGDIKCQLAQAYISQYHQEVNSSTAKNYDPGNCDVELDDMWLNIQREGDFNPVHNHNCRSVSGISTFCWLTFPKQVMKTSREGKKGSSHKGMTYLHWNSTPSWANKQFMFPGNVGLLPTPGAIVMFPSWLEHVVYPFNGPGKRRSLASNINVKF